MHARVLIRGGDVERDDTAGDDDDLRGARGNPGPAASAFVLQDEDGQIQEAHSVSAGLDYPGIGPEHAWLHDMGRVTFLSATDDEAVAAFQLCSRLEGIIPALEPAHALAHVAKIAPRLPADRPRYLMGVGTPYDLLQGMGAGLAPSDWP